LVDVLPPGWLPGITWYQVHALRATGAPDAGDGPPFPAGTGRAIVDRLLPWLDRVVDLGCGGLLLTPVAASSTHGYDTIDPFRLDPRLGSESDFDELVSACRRRGLRLVLDGVFNHVGRAFPRFVDVLERREQSPSVDWFHLDFAGGGEDGFAYRDFEGHRELVALDHRSPEVLDWAVDVCCHWLARGIDGWRFDVAYAIPTGFLRALRDRVLDRFPDAFLFGEMIHGDYVSFVEGSGLHAVTQYELHKALWSSCNDGNLFEMAWALRRHAEMAARFVPVTFAGNHDVTRLASRLANPAHLEAVLTVLFSVPGTPCVYYGDEWGATGVKRDGRGGDDEIRPRFDELAPDDATASLHQRLIAFRRARPWLTTGTLEIGEVRNHQLEFVVTGGGGDRLVVTLDLSTDPPMARAAD
jgi:cyclomaltodextrinase